MNNLECLDCLLLLMKVYRRLRQGNLSRVRVCQVFTLLHMLLGYFIIIIIIFYIYFYFLIIYLLNII